MRRYAWIVYRHHIQGRCSATTICKAKEYSTVKLLAALLLFPIWLFADSSIVVRDLSGSPQTNRAITVFRIFKAGDITQYAQASVGGTPLTTQCDVKTRWRDGSNTLSITGATNATPIVVTAANHGFLDGERVTITGVTGNTAANGTWTVRGTTTNTFLLLGST